jgi:hypothetical protein
MTQELHNKQIAVGLFGIHYQEDMQHWMGWIAQVDYKSVWENNKKILFDNFIPSFFSATYFSPMVDTLLKDFNFDAIKLKKITNIKQINLTDAFIIRNTIFLNTMRLIIESNKFYDYVLLTRYDLHFKEPILNYLKLEKINLICRTKWGSDEDLVDDNFYFMPFDKFKMFYNTINSIPITETSHRYHKYFNAEDMSYLVEGKFYSHEIPIYFIKRS